MTEIYKLIPKEYSSQVCLIIYKSSEDMLKNLIIRLEERNNLPQMKNEKVFKNGLILYTKCFIAYLNNFQLIMNSINVKENEIEAKLKLEMNTSLFNFLSVGFIDYINQIDEYFKLRQEVISLLNDYHLKMNSSMESLITGIDNDFVHQFYSQQHDEVQASIEIEDWNQLVGIPSNCQQMCDLILSVSDESLRTKAFNGVSEIFDLTQTSIMNNPNVSVVINNSIINNSILNNTIVNNSIINNSVINGNPINIEGESNLLLIQGKKFKTTKSFVKIINLLFDTIKFLTYFDNSLHEDILHLLAKSINIYIVIGKNIIIEGDGTIKGKSITEKEIALLCSNFNMLSFIMEHFLTLDKNETISLVVKGLINSLEKSKENCIDAISQLISEITKESLDEFGKLDFKNYPTFTEKDYNTYIKKFSKCKKLYDNLINCFDDKNIEEIFRNNFTTYFETLEKNVKSKSKIESDVMLKQFRTEMIYVKKILKLYDLCDTASFIEAVDRISKAANPNKILKKKTTKDSEPKEDNLV